MRIVPPIAATSRLSRPCDPSQLVRHHEFHPSKALFARGRAEWIPGQLDREIDRGVWRVASASPSLILRHATAKGDEEETDLWNDILHSMGGRFSNIGDNNKH